MRSTLGFLMFLCASCRRKKDVDTCIFSGAFSSASGGVGLWFLRPAFPNARALGPRSTLTMLYVVDMRVLLRYVFLLQPSSQHVSMEQRALIAPPPRSLMTEDCMNEKDKKTRRRQYDTTADTFQIHACPPFPFEDIKLSPYRAEHFQFSILLFPL